MKLIKSMFNEYTGQSVVTLKNRGKEYTGKAVLHSDEFEKASKYAGCRIAEKRALIKYYKEKKNEARMKRDALISFYTDLQNVTVMSEKEIPTEIIKRITVHIKYWNDIYLENRNNAEALRKSIQEDIELRESLFKKRSK